MRPFADDLYEMNPRSANRIGSRLGSDIDTADPAVAPSFQPGQRLFVGLALTPTNMEIVAITLVHAPRGVKIRATQKRPAWGFNMPAAGKSFSAVVFITRGFDSLAVGKAT